MAKQNPATDPVSAAMSAIESALNLTDDDGAVSVESASPPQLVPAKATTATPVLKPSPLPAEASTLLRPGPSSAASAPESVEAKSAIPTTAPANDDRETVGAILQAMNARPASRTPYILALIGALLWAAICALYAYVALWPTVPSRPADLLLRPETPLFLLAALAPIFCMFAFAALSRRLRELRLSARAISQVAVRLAEPEATAGEHMANLSQAIRRELTSMGDGVERALARAAELETRVQSEVSTLERSYSDNERRIRLLIAEMADQREAIVTSGTRVRDAIATAHDGIAADLNSAGASLSERLTETGQRLTASIGAASDDVARGLEGAGSTTLERIVAEGARMSVSIAGIGESLAERLADTSQKAAGDILARVGEVDNRLKAVGDNLLSRLGERGDNLIERIQTSQDSVVEAIDAHGDRVATRLGDAAEFARSAVGAHADEVVGRISGSSARAVEAIKGHGDAISDQLGTASLALSGAFGAHGDDIVGRINASSAEVLDAIRAHGDSVADRLSEAAAQASNAIGAHSDAVVSRVSSTSAEAARTLTTHADVLASRLSEAADIVNAHGDAVAAQLAGASAVISGAVAAYADEVVNRVGASGAQTVDAIRAQGDSGRRPTRPGLGGDAQRRRRLCR